MDVQPGTGNAIRDQLANFLSLVTTQVDSLEAQNRALLAERDRLGRELAIKQEEAKEAVRKASDAQAILDSAIAESDKRREQGSRYAEIIRAQAQQAAMSLRDLAERIEADAQKQASDFENSVRGALATAAIAAPAVLAPTDVPSLPFSSPEEDVEVAPTSEVVSADEIAESTDGEVEPFVTKGVVAEIVPVAEDVVFEAVEPVSDAIETSTAIDEPVVEVEAMANDEPVADVAEMFVTDDDDLLVVDTGRVTSEVEAISDEPQTILDHAVEAPEAVSQGVEGAENAPAIGLDLEPLAVVDAVEPESETVAVVEAETPVPQAPFVPPIIESNIAPPRPGVIFPALSSSYEPRSHAPVPPIVPPTVALPTWKPEVVSRVDPPVDPVVNVTEPVADAQDAVDESADDHRSGWQGAVINPGWTAPDAVGEDAEPAAPAADMVPTGALASAEPTTYDVIARPFTNFSSLVTFQKAIREIPGISDVRVKVFQNNALSMSLNYGGPTGVADALNLVSGFDVTDTLVDGVRVEMTVVSTASKASA